MSKVKMYHKRAIYIVDRVFILTIKLGITKPSQNPPFEITNYDFPSARETTGKS